jgi:hypothetical protein
MGGDGRVAALSIATAGVTEVAFPAALHRRLVDHGWRKLAGVWLPDEEQAPKAYGLVGGIVEGRRALVTHVLPLRNNLRDRPEFKPEVDRIMADVAVPSETPTDRRGWVADPLEVLAAERRCDAEGSVLFGAYHMHRVAWARDPRRDTCTELDRCLARHSGLWTFILSLVDPDRPVLRAFFEGDNAREAVIRTC